MAEVTRQDSQFGEVTINIGMQSLPDPNQSNRRQLHALYIQFKDGLQRAVTLKENGQVKVTDIDYKEVAYADGTLYTAQRAISDMRFISEQFSAHPELTGDSFSKFKSAIDKTLQSAPNLNIKPN